jgi:hypothetical protein
MTEARILRYFTKFLLILPEYDHHILVEPLDPASVGKISFDVLLELVQRVFKFIGRIARERRVMSTFRLLDKLL